MWTPAAAALRPPSVSRGSTAVGSRPLSANPRQGDHEDIQRINARKKYEFYLAHLHRVENNLDYVRVFTERCEKAIKYVSWSFMVIMPTYFVVVVAKAARKPESSSTSDSSST